MIIKERKVWSQNGEDGVIESIFKQIGTTDTYFVEIGVEDGHECNTRLLSDKGWTGIRLDDMPRFPETGILLYTVTPENVAGILTKHGVAFEFDLFSIDIDGFDFHVLAAVLSEFSPRVIVTEYNPVLGPETDGVQPYVAGESWDSTDFYGASFAAYKALGTHFGYVVVYCEKSGTNLFMVRDDLLLEPDGEFAPSASPHVRDPHGRVYESSSVRLGLYRGNAL